MKRNGTLTLTELIRRLFDLAKPQARLIVISTLASILGNLSHMGMMGFGAALILSCAGRLHTGTPWLWGALALGCALMIGIMRYYEGVDSHAAAYELLAGMRLKLYHALRRLAPACLVDHPKGDILSIAIADIETIESFFAHTIGPMFTVILLPLTALIVAAAVHWIFAAALLPMYLIISVGIPLAALKAGRILGQRYRGEIGAMKTLVLESVYGLKDIQIFGEGPRRLHRIGEKGRQINRAYHGIILHRQLVTSLPTFFIYLVRIMIIFIATALAIKDPESLNGVIILSFVVSASFSSTQSLITVVSSLLETFAAAERYFAITDEEPAVVEAEDALPLEQVETLEFDHVSFHYAESEDLILDEAVLRLDPQDKVGLVGESGAGKSTILRLLLRFWDPTDGTIRINGEDLRKIRLRDLRARVAMLEQSTFLYDETIAANIALGRPDAGMEEIREAARRAGIHRLIETLPEGYDTPMGEQGNRLSGGEKQRIGIARILLADPDVIIMDEPTSNLDVFNEKLLLKTLEEGYADKTVLIVSHRVSTLTGCDRVVVMNRGTLVETVI